MAGIIVKPRSRIYHGHDWVYSSEVLKAWGEPKDGEVIVIKDGKDRLLGSAIYNSKSQIIARRFSRQKQDIDTDFLQRRIAQSVMYRKRRECDPQLARLVWSESDGLPGLIVDRYGDYLVVQTLTMAMDRRREEIATVLQEQLNPKGIVERNDAPIRIAEGLELRTGILRGDAPTPFVIRVADLEFEVDLRRPIRKRPPSARLLRKPGSLRARL
jgi:23S rRNA (cytosine1962-C5)-methyltransferase